jgi:eukaryotic-like serine/threonine-protein kinase
VDLDVQRLVLEERLLEAGKLASERGDARTATSLFERACAWQLAAEQAEKCGDLARALLLSREARDEAQSRRLLHAMGADTSAAARLAATLEARGDWLWAARLYEAAGMPESAASRWERAGDARRAAELFEEAGDVAKAARTLEAALKKNAEDYALAVQLGALLVRYGKHEAAFRTLQRVPKAAHERRAALTLMIGCLAGIGIARGSEDLESELADLGGALALLPQARPQAVRRTRLFGRYELISEIASTAAARVIECIDVVRQESVALKIFAGYDASGGGRDALLRFEREVRALATLDHPNIVPLRDYIEEGPALVMAWMPGGTLETLLAREPVTPKRATEIASAMLLALAEAHRLGILHRDVKPANILFDAGGSAKLADFGVSHLSDLSATATAGIIGTLEYMSPEQRAGIPATVRSDIYGIGAILLEMLSGENSGATTPRPRQPSAFHRDLRAPHDAVVAQLVAEDPRSRPVDALAARSLLASVAWPDTLEPLKLTRVESERPAAHDALQRYAMTPGTTFDRLLERTVLEVQITETQRERAQQYARVCHPALQALLSSDRTQKGVMLAQKPRGTTLERALLPQERVWLQGALRALHHANFVHGSVDRNHVWVDPGRFAMLRFPAGLAQGRTAEQDLEDLEALC